MNTILQCTKCAGNSGAMNASGHKCEGCGHRTYSAMKLCGACGLLFDECMFCRAKLNLNIGAATIEKVRALVDAHNSERASIDADYDETVAPIKDELESFQKDNNQVWEEYQAASKIHEHVVTWAGGGQSLEAKSPEDEEAMTEARRLRDAKMTAVDERFAPHRPLFDYASRKQQLARQRSDRRFNLNIDCLIVQVRAPLAFEEELARVDEQFERSMSALVDPRTL